MSKNLITLVGSPNSGKTTLFNSLTGLSGNVMNYPGATVDYRVAPLAKAWGADLKIVDTPGTYSLFPKSPEEQIAVNLLIHAPKLGSPACVICVVDSTQLSRHLFLVRQLKKAGFPVVMALTMTDLAQKEGYSIDLDKLSAKMGLPVLLVNGKTGHGIPELLDKVRSTALIGTSGANMELPQMDFNEQWSQLKEISKITDEVKILKKSLEQSPRSRTLWLDSFVLHPILGPAIFVGVMTILFSSIFWLASPVMDLLSLFFDTLANKITNTFPGHLWADLLGHGIIASFGAVFVFTPQIFILFFVISILEDSGYLARAASLVDKPLSKMGLNGRSFVPLLSGYACAIPAMLAARTIPSRKERFLTLAIIPLMSCSARLPVFAVLLGFLFWKKPSWQPGLALAGIYLLSIFIAGVVASILQRYVKFSEKSFFLLELPLYRRPNLKGIFKSSHQKTLNYIMEAGPVIFTLAVFLWAATTFPNYNTPDVSTKLETSYAAQAGRFIDPLMEPMGADWRIGAALISAFVAREVFVPSLAVMLHAPSEGGQVDSLLDNMRRSLRSDGTPLFTPSSIIALILFFMIALQCMATVGIARKEFGNWTYPMLQLVGFNILAYTVAVTSVQLLHWMGIP